MVKFIFDLDGTITKFETLPIIAKYFSIHEEIEKLTEKTVQGNIPFIESFIYRVMLLGKYPIDEIAQLLAQVALHEKLYAFIQDHAKDCVIATGNLFCWIEKLLTKFPCEAYFSEAEIENNQVKKIHSILRKENLVEKYKREGYHVVFIGDGNNDMEAMRKADVSIATGLVHYPASSVLSVADYAVFSEEALCRLLNQLL